ncbi:hypothetical protein RFI_04790, partial [Reticulomyxa filosa]
RKEKEKEKDVLPKNIINIRYFLSITPNLAKNFRFFGLVEIDLLIKDDRDFVILNKVDLLLLKIQVRNGTEVLDDSMKGFYVRSIRIKNLCKKKIKKDGDPAYCDLIQFKGTFYIVIPETKSFYYIKTVVFDKSTSRNIMVRVWNQIGEKNYAIFA